jgi:cytochrome c5
VSAEQDRRFFDIFMVVLGSLVAVAVGIYALAQVVQARTQEEYIKEDAMVQAQITERIAPIGQVAIAGADNSRLAAPAAGPQQPAPVQVAQALSGQDVYQSACSACHGAGVAGAPKFGDAAAWADRISKGIDTLTEHAINGFQGSAGFMPPKGGRADLSDDAVKAGVQYMVDNSK